MRYWVSDLAFTIFCYIYQYGFQPEILDMRYGKVVIEFYFNGIYMTFLHSSVSRECHMHSHNCKVFNRSKFRP